MSNEPSVDPKEDKGPDPLSSEPKQHRTTHSDRVRLVGLIAFFAVMALIIALIWPYVGMIFEPDGLEKLLDQVRDAGWTGVLILEALQFLQVVVAFIPGEAVQIAAGMLYGPWWGALIILVGCIFSSAFIFVLVHKLGAPFVRDMVPEKYMTKFHEFEQSKKFVSVIFLLFLIPGMPKDVFTYITPLSDMKLKQFLLITNTARIPGIVISTYAADGLMEGRLVESIIMFVVLAIIAVIALVVYNKVSTKHAEKKNA